MKVSEFVSKLNAEAFFDYTKNKVTLLTVKEFAEQAREELGIILDDGYVELLSSVNGFEVNGLNFYGIGSNENLYVYDFFERNKFWKEEILLHVRLGFRSAFLGPKPLVCCP